MRIKEVKLYSIIFSFLAMTYTQLVRFVCNGGWGVAVAQSVEQATPGEEVPGSITAVAARSLLVGWMSV